MPLLDRQRGGAVLGQLRMGQKIVKDGKERPTRLTTWRMTSPDESKIRAAAELYGGEVRPWQPREGAGQQWEVVTGTDRMTVRVPPGEPVEQDYMLFGGRPVVRQRLCDGFRERLSGNPCLCPVDLDERRSMALANPPAACRPTTQIKVILSDLPGLGVWALTTRGDNAADELGRTAELLRSAENRGVSLGAVLRLEQRESRGSGQVHQFVVPVLDVQATLAELEAGTYARVGITAGGEPARAQTAIGGPAQQALPAGDGSSDAAQAIADQVAQASDVADVDALWQRADRDGLLDAIVVPEQGPAMKLRRVLAARGRVLSGQDGDG